MMKAGKFIDYFVHDILDYTIINREGKKFTIDSSVFDVRESIHEILEIMEDKAQMKQITVSSQFINFP